MLARSAAVLAGLWAGVLACIAAIAAPAAFAVLPLADAGRFVGRVFAQEAYLSIGAALLLFFIERWRQRHGDGTGRVMNANVLLLLGTLFCTVAGYFALVPLMEAARAGQGRFSFAALHAVSGSLFALKGVLVLVLAWRLGPLKTAATSS